MSKPRKRYRPRPIMVPVLLRTSFVFSEVEAILNDVGRGEVLVDHENVVIRFNPRDRADYYDVVPTLTFLTDALDAINNTLGWCLPTREFTLLADELRTPEVVNASTLRACWVALRQWQAMANQIPADLLDRVSKTQKIRIELEKQRAV